MREENPHAGGKWEIMSLLGVLSMQLNWHDFSGLDFDRGRRSPTVSACVSPP